jgi:histidinol-phosphate aminotransferase
VNVAANVAAQVSLEYADELKALVAKLRHERGRLAEALDEVPYLWVYPTQSNFILCRVVDRDAFELKNKLAQEHGIFVRYFNKPSLRDRIRISVGRPEDTDALIKALKE